MIASSIPATPRRSLAKRFLLYTGVTRGKRLVVLVGQKKAVAIAVRNVSGPYFEIGTVCPPYH